MSLTVCHIEWNFKFHVWRMSWGQGKHKCIIALLAETTRGELLWKSRWEYERKKAWEIRKKGNCCQSKAQSSPGKEGGRGNGRKGANRENTSKWKRENCSICFCKDRLFRVLIKIKIKKKLYIAQVKIFCDLVCMSGSTGVFATHWSKPKKTAAKLICLYSKWRQLGHFYCFQIM